MEKRALTEQERETVERVCKTHEYGIMLAVLYYLGLRRGEALGLMWGDFDWDSNIVSIKRDIDYVSGNKGNVDDLKTNAAYRDIPIDDDLRDLLYPNRGLEDAFLFCGKDKKPLCMATFLRHWMALMIECEFARQVIRKGTQKKRKIDLRFD